MPINNNDFSSDHVIRNFSDEHLYRGRRNPKSLLNCAKTITTYQKCVNAGSDNRGHPLLPGRVLSSCATFVQPYTRTFFHPVSSPLVSVPAFFPFFCSSIAAAHCAGAL